MSRQFTDGEVRAAIQEFKKDGKRLSRVALQKHLGGGSSGRIDAILKEHNAKATNGTSLAPPAQVDAHGASNARPVISRQQNKTVAVGDRPDTQGRAYDISIEQLQSQVRVLEILLASERKARQDDEARNKETVAALQREIEIARRGKA